MTELFANISDDVRQKADIIWKITLAQPHPLLAAKFLNYVTEYYRHKWTEEEVEFLQFYIQTQMEMMNK
mgnify:CR=1 FL=1